MKILRQKTGTRGKTAIETLIKTEKGIFLLKTKKFQDNTATSRFYKIEFAEFGEMLCIDRYGKIYESNINGKTSLQNIHDCAFFKMQEQYKQLTK